jgi:hypothetical protein
MMIIPRIPPVKKYFDFNKFLCLVSNRAAREEIIKNVMEYLFKKPIPQTKKMSIQNLVFCVFISFIIRYPDRSQKNWLNDTGWNRVLDLRNAGDNINADMARIIAIIPPFSSFTKRAIMMTDILPIRAGKKRKAKVVLPKIWVANLEITPIRGGTETYPQERCSPSE